MIALWRSGLFAVLLTFADAAWAQSVAFSAVPVGSLPAQFESTLTGDGQIGFWAVVQDDTAQGGRALEQRTPDPTDYRFPLAIHQPVVACDLEVSIRFKPVAGRADQAGGIAIRVLDADNCYVVRANALENNVRFYRVVSGKRQQLAGADTRVTSGEWHKLTLRAEEDRFTVWFDGQELFSATGRAFGVEGRVALWTKADSVTRFDRLEIRPLS